jgi:hypothetical protein
MLIQLGFPHLVAFIIQIWDFAEKQMRVLVECDRPDHGITDIRHISLR